MAAQPDIAVIAAMKLIDEEGCPTWQEYEYLLERLRTIDGSRAGKKIIAARIQELESVLGKKDMQRVINLRKYWGRKCS